MSEDKIIENATLPKKRVSPFEVGPIDEVNEPKKIEKKTKTSTTSKKEVAKKPTTQNLQLRKQLLLKKVQLQK